MDRAAGFNLMSAGDELFDGKLFMVKENLFINFMVSKSKKKNLKNSSFFQTKKIAEKRFPLRMQCKMLWWKINYVKDEDESYSCQLEHL